MKVHRQETTALADKHETTAQAEASLQKAATSAMDDSTHSTISETEVNGEDLNLWDVPKQMGMWSPTATVSPRKLTKMIRPRRDDPDYVLLVYDCELKYHDDLEQCETTKQEKAAAEALKKIPRAPLLLSEVDDSDSNDSSASLSESEEGKRDEDEPEWEVLPQLGDDDEEEEDKEDFVDEVVEEEVVANNEIVLEDTAESQKPATKQIEKPFDSITIVVPRRAPPIPEEERPEPPARVRRVYTDKECALCGKTASTTGLPAFRICCRKNCGAHYCSVSCFKRHVEEGGDLCWSGQKTAFCMMGGRIPVSVYNLSHPH